MDARGGTPARAAGQIGGVPTALQISGSLDCPHSYDSGWVNP